MPVMPQKLAGWRIEPPVSVPVAAGIMPGRHRCGGSARRSAGNPQRVPGVARHTVGRVFVRRAHREFVAVELAQRHRAGLRQAADDGGIERAAVALEHLRAGGGGQIPRNKDVLVCDRHAQQRQRVRRLRAGRRRPRPAPAPVRRRRTARRRDRHERRHAPADAAPLRRSRPCRRPAARASSATPQWCRSAGDEPLIRSPSAPGTGRPRPPVR